MTSKNLNSGNNPFLLIPVGKDYLWGGNRLKEEFSKDIQMTPLAETWECSTHAAGSSTVRNGEFAGKSLTEVLKEHPQFLGTHPKSKLGLPILVKLIDAKEDLSVQVHPNDEYAAKHENGSLGKSEMWYVLDADCDSKLIYGFYRDMDREVLKKSLNEGTVEKYLRKVKIKKNDVFFVEAGCVHAIGAGALIAEIQESSDITYRMYDYDRLDENGCKRTLSIDKALDVANLSGSMNPRQPMRVLKYQRGYASELLCRCRYFQVERILINTMEYENSVVFKAESNSFQIYLCVDGEGFLCEAKETTSDAKEPVDSFPFQKGDCFFVPADSILFTLRGKAQLLKVGC